MTAFELNAIAQLSATRIVDCLVEGSLIAAFAGLALKLRRQDSRTTFAVWFAVLLAIAALPFARLWTHGGNLSAAGHSALTLPESWALYLFGAWAVVALWSLARVAISLWHLRTLRRSCVVLDLNTIDESLQKTLARKQGIRKVKLCVSDRIHVPTAIGLFWPVVVIPRWVLRELSPVELNHILLHELAHLCRWDDWTNLAQQIVKALFFFHPAVWWIERKISLEREMACDDAVLAETASPRAYAECLANLAERTFIQRSLALAQAVLGRIRNTSMRVARILDVNRPAETTHPWKIAVPLVAVFAGACVLGGSQAPQLVAFSSGVPSAALAIADSRPDSGISHFSLPATPVSLRSTAQHPVAAVKTRKKTVLRPKTEHRPMFAQIQPPPMEQIIHLAKLSPAPMVATETIFVLVQGQNVSVTGAPVYQLQVWQLTVWHPAVDVDKKIPPKQI